MENVKEYSVQKFCVININNQKNQSGRLPRQSFVAGQNQTEHAIKLAGSERPSERPVLALPQQSQNGARKIREPDRAVP